MTTIQAKKPLPSCTPPNFPERPSSAAEWTCALQQAKGFYFQAQYKQCSILCQRLLLELDSSPHPLHSTCLHFYSALANEAIARLAHNLATSKLQTLRCAKVSYQDALRSMPKPKPIPMDRSAANVEAVSGVKPRLLMAPITTRPNSNRPDSEVLGNRYDDGMTDDEYYEEDGHANVEEGSSGGSTPTVDSHSESPRGPSSQSSVESFHDAQEKEQEHQKRMSRTASTISATSIQLQLLSSRASGSAIYFGCNVNDSAHPEDDKMTPHPLRISSRNPTTHVSTPSTSTTVTAASAASPHSDPPIANHGTGFRLSRPTSVYYPSNPFSLSRASSLSRRSHLSPSAPSASDLALLPNPAPPTLTSSPEAQAVMRFNAQLYGFKDVLYSHIEDVNNAIGQTEEVQRERKEMLLNKGGRKGVVFEDSVDEEGVKRRRRERIEKLRQDGWRGERFWGKRYQRMAERAEGELVGCAEAA